MARSAGNEIALFKTYDWSGDCLRVQERGSGGEGENCEQVSLLRIFLYSPSSDNLQQVPFKIKGEFLLGIFL